MSISLFMIMWLNNSSLELLMEGLEGMIDGLLKLWEDSISAFFLSSFLSLISSTLYQIIYSSECTDQLVKEFNFFKIQLMN